MLITRSDGVSRANIAVWHFINEICEGIRKLCQMLKFLQVFDLVKGQREGQCQVCAQRSEIIVAMIVV